MSQEDSINIFSLLCPIPNLEYKSFTFLIK